jgi:cellulose synthase/poly-beta-1,6-N-acetylglucosamine synthase-like glycosyltransferase
MITGYVFWTLIGLLSYSYFLFPVIIGIIAKSKRKQNNFSPVQRDLPRISIIVSAYNEQKHIGDKIRNIMDADYPADKLELIIGSDGSNDATNQIIDSYLDKCTFLKPLYFKERRGKSGVLNDCVSVSTGEILILTDAKATFESSLMMKIIQNFNDPQIGIAGATIINKNGGCRGITHQESAFMSQEIKVKYFEGVAYGCCIGIYGACYAIRRELYTNVPSHFAVDDFYISMKVLERGYKVILDTNSICYENVTSKVTEEFRRKVRIGVGNIQNLRAFSGLLFRFNPISFCYFSHKVIRWLGPFFLLAMLFLNFRLWNEGTLYKIFLIVQLFSILASVVDFYLKKIHLQIILLRFITHFYTMNLALLVGFFKYLIGVKANVWEPTNR